MNHPAGSAAPALLVPTVPGAADHPAASGWPREDPRWNDPAATVAMVRGAGRRPLAPPAPPPAPAWKRVGVGLGVGLAVILLGVATTRVLAGDGPGADPYPGTTVVPDSSTKGMPADETSAEPTYSYLAEEGVLTMGDGARYQVGEPGDILVVGDWDCRGDSTPGLYRPRTGEVFLFDVWPTGDEVTSRPAAATGITGGEAQVSGGPDGCDILTLTPP